MSSGLTEEEFQVFQDKMMELGQEIYQLNEKLDEYKGKIINNQTLRDNLESKRLQHKENDERHENSVGYLRQELESMKRQIHDINTKASKQIDDQINTVISLNQENSDLIVKTEGQIEGIRAQTKKHDSKMVTLNKKVETLSKQVQKYEPILEFYNNSRAIPLLLEDLNRKKESLSASIHELVQTNEKVERSYFNTKRLSDDTLARIREKTEYMNSLKNEISQLQTTMDTLHSKDHLIIESQIRLDQAIKSTQRVNDQLNQILSSNDIETYEHRIAELTAKKTSIEDSYTERLNSQESTLKDLSDELTKHTKKYENLLETGKDPDLPSVSGELQIQIDGVQAKNTALDRNILILKREKETLKSKIAKSKSHLDLAALLTSADEKTKSNPVYQTQIILIEELIYQNKHLKDQIGVYKQKIGHNKHNLKHLLETLA